MENFSGFLHCKQMGSQPLVLRFMVHAQNVIRHRQQGPFRTDLFCSTKHETAKLEISFCVGKHALRLDGTVQAKRFSFLSGNLLFHRLALSGKVFGYFQALTAFLQRQLAF